MRRSLVFMLSASIAVHVIVLTTYLLTSMADRRGTSSSNGEAVSLIVATPFSSPAVKPDGSHSSPPKAAMIAETSTRLPDMAIKPLLSDSNEPNSPSDLIPPQSPKNPITPKQVLKKITPPLEIIKAAQVKSSPPPESKSLALSGHRSVVFLLDVSGSMYEDDGFTTRDIQGRAILTKMIAVLPSDELFTIVFYAETSQIAFPLQLATDDAKKSSLHYVALQAECGGGTNLPIGLGTAFSLNPSEIVLITDGDLNMDFRDIVTKSPPFDGDKTSIKIVGIDPREGSNDLDLLKSLADHYDGSFSQVAAQNWDPVSEH